MMKQDCPNALTVRLPSRDVTVQSEYPYRFKEVFLKYLEMRLPSLVFGVTPNAVRLLLQRLSARSAHSQHTVSTQSAHVWRRGWAVQALRNDVSEASVKAAAGWPSGAMVAYRTHQ